MNTETLRLLREQILALKLPHNTCGAGDHNEAVLQALDTLDRLTLKKVAFTSGSNSNPDYSLAARNRVTQRYMSARLNLALSADQVAERIGCSWETIVAIESGLLQPRGEVEAAFAELYKVDASYLRGETKQ